MGKTRNGWDTWHIWTRREMGGTRGTYGQDEKWVGHMAHMGETHGTYGRDEKWVGHVAHMGEMRNADRVFVGKCERMGTMWTIQA